MTTSRDDNWPDSERYRALLPVAAQLPLCRVCASRHDTPLPWCAQDNTERQPGEDDMAANGIENYEARGTYIGPAPLLKGYTASLICYPSTGRCIAMFDNIESGFAGWSDFHLDHFKIEEQPNG